MGNYTNLKLTKQKHASYEESVEYLERFENNIYSKIMERFESDNYKRKDQDLEAMINGVQIINLHPIIQLNADLARLTIANLKTIESKMIRQIIMIKVKRIMMMIKRILSKNLLMLIRLTYHVQYCWTTRQ